MTIDLPINQIQPTTMTVTFKPDQEPDVDLGGTPSVNVYIYLSALLQKIVEIMPEQKLAISPRALYVSEECEWQIEFESDQIISSGQAPLPTVAAFIAAWIRYYEEQATRHKKAMA